MLRAANTAPPPPKVKSRRAQPALDDDAHAGNWKIVYADFATAMMAFFLLLWVGSIATDEQRDMLADYFNPVAVSRGNSGADGALSGRSVDTIGAMTSPAARGETAFPVASPPTLAAMNEADAPAPDSPRPGAAPDDAAVFARLEAELRVVLLETGGRELLDGIAFRRTKDGLLIDLLDRPDKPLFEPGGAQLSDSALPLIAAAANALARAPNELRLTGHTDARPFANPGYDNMDLSADRARAARRALLTAGLATDRIVRIEGAGEVSALSAAEPDASTHRRITLAVLRRPARSLGLIDAE